MKSQVLHTCDLIFMVRLQGKLVVDHSWEWKGHRGDAVCVITLSRGLFWCISRMVWYSSFLSRAVLMNMRPNPCDVSNYKTTGPRSATQHRTRGTHQHTLIPYGHDMRVPILDQYCTILPIGPMWISLSQYTRIRVGGSILVPGNKLASPGLGPGFGFGMALG